MKKLTKFKNQPKYFKIIMIVLLLILVFGILFLVLTQSKKNEETVDEVMSITTNKGNVIDMEYQDVGKFLIKIPKDFKLMSEDILQVKYPSANRPTLVYTNEDTSVNVAFNLDNNSLKGVDVSEYVESLKLEFQNMGYFYYSFDYEVNDLIVYTLSLTTPAVDTAIHNYMIIFSIDDQIMIVNFNCIIEYMDEWNDVAKFIAKSIKVK